MLERLFSVLDDDVKWCSPWGIELMDLRKLISEKWYKFKHENLDRLVNQSN